MSLKISFASLSLAASVDQQTGSLSVFELIEEIRTPKVPVYLQSLVISLVMEKTVPEELKGKVFIHIIPPDNKQQLVGQGDLVIPAERKRAKAVFRFGGFPIFSFGMHRFVVSWANVHGQKEAEAILDFEAIEVPQIAEAAVDPSEKPPITH